jgi:hypothetical protein
MSLLRLLTSGKCLVGMKDSDASRYRMRPKALLPKFGSPKNPFITRSEPAQIGSPQAAVAAALTAEPMTPAESAAAGLKETQRLPVTASTGTARRIPGTNLAAGVLQGMQDLAGKLNPLRWRAEKPSSRPAPVRTDHSSPVQGELSLDRIKVVRNDLNDADLEIIPAESRATRKSLPVLPLEKQGGIAAAQPR